MPTFKHKSIKRAKFGRFEFNEFLLHVEEKDLSEFLELMAAQPLMYQREVVQVNEAALAALERPLSQTIRGASQSSHFSSAVTKGVDTEALQKQGDADRAEKLKLAAENDRLRQELAEAKKVNQPAESAIVPPKSAVLDTVKIAITAPGGHGNSSGPKTPPIQASQPSPSVTKPAEK